MKEIILPILMLIPIVHLFIEWWKYNSQLEIQAKKSAERYSEFSKTDCYTYLDFIKINKKNPGFIDFGPIRQNELIKEHGDNLMYSFCD